MLVFLFLAMAEGPSYFAGDTTIHVKDEGPSGSLNSCSETSDSDWEG